MSAPNDPSESNGSDPTPPPALPEFTPASPSQSHAAPAYEAALAPAPEPATAPEPVPAAEPAPMAAAQPAPAAPGATAQAVDVDLAALRAKAELLGLVNPVPGLIVAGSTWAGGLIVSVLLMVLTAIAGATMGSGSIPTDMVSSGPLENTSGAGVLFAMPFQLLALAGLGSFGANIDAPIVGQIAFSIRLIPFLALCALILLPFFGARLVVRRRGGARLLGVAAEALLMGLVVAILVTLGALIFAVRAPVEDGITIAMHAAGADSFFGTWFIVGMAYAIGLIAASRGPRVHGRFSDVVPALRLAGLHAAVFTLVASIALWISAIIHAISSGDSMLGAIIGLPLLAIVLLGQVIAALCGLGMLGSVGVTGGIGGFGLGGSSMGGAQYAWLFDLPLYMWLIGLVLGLLVTVVIATAWGARRMMVPGDVTALAVSWAAVPAAYFIGGIVLAILGHVGMVLTGASDVLGGGMQGSAGLAPWVPFLALVVGAVVEGLSRVLGPLAGEIVPSFVERVVRGRSAVTAGAPVPSMGAPVAAGAQVPSSVSGGSSASADASASAAPATATLVAAPREPMTTEAKRRLLLILGLVGAALALVVAAIVTVVVVSSTVFSPKHQVEEYLDAVSAGSFGKASQLAPPNADNANRVLLTDEVGAKTTQRLTSYTIDDVKVSGDDAAVSATLEYDGKRSQKTFSVHRSGSRFVVFPEWKLADPEYSTVTFTVPKGLETVKVNGVAIPVAKLKTTGDEEGFTYAELPALPGSYEFTADAPSEYVQTVPATAVIGPDGATDPNMGAVFLGDEITPKGLEKLQADVNAKIDACAATGQASPAG